jgi:superfamily II DNA or RNA helicase
MTDADGTKVELLWRDISQANETTKVRADFRWSFGDPLRAVFDLDKAIEDVATNSSVPLAELEQTLRDLISALQPPTLPWEEKFEEPDSSAIVLYPHQTQAISAWFENGGRGIFKMCTGAGKTISSLMAARRLGEEEAIEGRPRPPVLVTVPTRVLADQWIEEIKRLGFVHVLKAYESVARWEQIIEPWMADKSADTPRFVVSTYCTFADERFLQKLERVARQEMQALWIADELHNLSSSRLLDGMRRCATLFEFRLGLSATPDIEGNPAATERLRNFFGNQCASYELADGIRDGVLCSYRYHPVPAYLAPDRGERYLALLQQIDQAESGSPALLDLYRQSRDLLRTSGVQVAKFRDLLAQLCASGESLAHTLVYCPPGYGSYGDESSDEIDGDPEERRLIEEVVATLRDYRVTSSSILGNTPSDQRREILQRFSAGELQALCAIGCLDEGIDIPSIQRAVVLHSVDREKQFVQRRGRILRQPRGTKGKVAEIYV